MRKIILLLLLVPLLNNCTQYTAMVGPSLTFAHTGSVLQASTSLSSSLAVNKIKNDYTNELKVELPGKVDPLKRF